MGIDPALSTRTLSDTAQEHLDDHNAIHAYLNSTPRIGVKAYLNGSAQSIANNSNVAIALNAEDFDSHGFHDNVTNNTRFTIPAGLDGLYLVVGQVAHGLDTAGTTRGCNIHKNGSMRGQTYMAPNQTFDTVVQASCILPMVAGDYVELVGYQNSGSANDVVASISETWMALTYLGA